MTRTQQLFIVQYFLSIVVKCCNIFWADSADLVNFNPLKALFLQSGDTYYKTLLLTSVSLSDGVMLVSEWSGTFLLSARFSRLFSLVKIFIFAVSFWFSAFAFSLFNRLFFKPIEGFLFFISFDASIFSL